MHIHPSSPNSEFNITQSEEYAAVRIQAGFRGYRVRKQLQRNGNNNNNKQLNNKNSKVATKRPRQHISSAALQLHQHQPNIMSLPSETSSSAAGKASINGALPHTTAAAATIEDRTLEDRCATKIQAGVRGYLVRKKQKLASDAATKIQASFRGFKARKELKQK